MANRRMFSNRIANSARFLQMPSEAQNLYFHMVMRADDDGIVESYPLLKLLGLAPDNFKILVAKHFIEQLNEDQVVVVSEWLEHNSIRADRKVDSIYIHLLPEKIKIVEAKPRSDVADNSKRLGGPSTDGISKVRLGKVRLGKDKKDTLSAKADEVFSFVEELEKLRNNNLRKDYKIIALYWKKKNWKFDNKEQFSSALTRELRAAKTLKGYSGEDIAKSIKHCEINYEEWSLETVFKRIQDVITKK